MRPNRRLGHAAQAKDRRKGRGNEKRESLIALPRSMPILSRKETGDIPTPPRATTNLFDATCTPAGSLEKTGEVRADVTRSAENPNRIVNLTLTSQTSRLTGAKLPAAWTLQELSCTTNRGRRLPESGTDVSLHAPAQVRAFKI